MVFASSDVTLHFALECCHTSATTSCDCQWDKFIMGAPDFCLWLLMTKKNKLKTTCGNQTALRKIISQMFCVLVLLNLTQVLFLFVNSWYLRDILWIDDLWLCVPPSTLVEVARTKNMLQWGSDHWWEIFFFLNFCIKLHLIYFSGMFCVQIKLAQNIDSSVYYISKVLSRLSLFFIHSHNLHHVVRFQVQKNSLVLTNYPLFATVVIIPLLRWNKKNTPANFYDEHFSLLYIVLVPAEVNVQWKIRALNLKQTKHKYLEM